MTYEDGIDSAAIAISALRADAAHGRRVLAAALAEADSSPAARAGFLDALAVELSGAE